MAGLIQEESKVSFESYTIALIGFSNKECFCLRNLLLSSNTKKNIKNLNKPYSNKQEFDSSSQNLSLSNNQVIITIKLVQICSDDEDFIFSELKKLQRLKAIIYAEEGCLEEDIRYKKLIEVFLEKIEGRFANIKKYFVPFNYSSGTDFYNISNKHNFDFFCFYESSIMIYFKNNLREENINQIKKNTKYKNYMYKIANWFRDIENTIYERCKKEIIKNEILGQIEYFKTCANKKSGFLQKIFKFNKSHPDIEKISEVNLKQDMIAILFKSNSHLSYICPCSFKKKDCLNANIESVEECKKMFEVMKCCPCKCNREKHLLIHFKIDRNQNNQKGKTQKPKQINEETKKNPIPLENQKNPNVGNLNKNTKEEIIGIENKASGASLKNANDKSREFTALTLGPNLKTEKQNEPSTIKNQIKIENDVKQNLKPDKSNLDTHQPQSSNQVNLNEKKKVAEISNGTQPKKFLTALKHIKSHSKILESAIKLFIIIGGPGAGKKSLIWSFMNYFEKKKHNELVPIDEIAKCQECCEDIFEEEEEKMSSLYTVKSDNKIYGLINIYFNPQNSQSNQIINQINSYDQFGADKITLVLLKKIDEINQDKDNLMKIMDSLMDFEKICLLTFSHQGVLEKKIFEESYTLVITIQNDVYIQKNEEKLKASWSKLGKKMSKVLTKLEEIKELNQHIMKLLEKKTKEPDPKNPSSTLSYKDILLSLIQEKSITS